MERYIGEILGKWIGKISKMVVHISMHSPFLLGRYNSQKKNLLKVILSFFSSKDGRDVL